MGSGKIKSFIKITDCHCTQSFFGKRGGGGGRSFLMKRPQKFFFKRKIKFKPTDMIFQVSKCKILNNRFFFENGKRKNKSSLRYLLELLSFKLNYVQSQYQIEFGEIWNIRNRS